MPRDDSAIYDEYHGNNTNDEYAFGLVNGGGCRASIPVGHITKSDLVNVFPFDNLVVRMEFTGELIWGMFNRILSGLNPAPESRDAQKGTLFQVSHNVKVVWGFDAPDRSRRLRTVTVNGLPLIMDQTYSVLTTDFLSLGGDNYWPKEDFRESDHYGLMEHTLISYLSANSPLDSFDSRRIHELSGAEWGKPEPPQTVNTEPQEDRSAWTLDSAAAGVHARDQSTVAFCLAFIIAAFFLQ